MGDLKQALYQNLICVIARLIQQIYTVRDYAST